MGGLVFGFLFIFLPPDTWLMEVRQTLYVFRTSSVTYSLFPDNSHSGQVKRAASDGQWQMPWLGCKSRTDMEQYLLGSQGANSWSNISASSNLLLRGLLREGDCIFVFKSILLVIQTAFCPFYPSFVVA